MQPRVRVASLVAALAISVSAATGSAFAAVDNAPTTGTKAAEPTRPAPGAIGVAVSPPRLELGVNPQTDLLEARLSIANLSGQQNLVSATLADLFISQDGAYQALPPNGTPYSVAAHGSLDRTQLELSPLGTSGASTEVRLTVRLSEEVRQGKLLYGAILVKPQVPETETSAAGQSGPRFGARIEPVILVPIILAPLAADGRTDRIAPSIQLGVEPNGVGLAQKERAAGLDRLIPITLPRVADQAPLQVTSSVRNTGDAFSRAFTTYRFSSVNLLGWLPDGLKQALDIRDTVFLEVEAAPSPAMPGSVAQSTAETLISNGGRSSETAPLVGLVRVQAETRMQLVDATTTPVTQEDWIIVLPWKELIAAALVFAIASRARTLLRRTPRRERTANSAPAVA